MTQYKKISMLIGVDQLRDQRDISDDELVSSKNLVPTTPGRVGKRLGLGHYRTLYPNANQSAAIYTHPLCAVFPPDDLRKKGLFMVGADIVNINDGSGQLLQIRLYDLAGTTTEVRQPIWGPVYPTFYLAQNKVWVLIGGMSPFPGYVVQAKSSGSGYEIVQWTFDNPAVNTNTFGANYVTSFKGRPIFLNLGVGHESRMIWADPDTPNVVGTNAITDRTFLVGNTGDDYLVGATEVVPTGTGLLAQSSLIVFKRRSTYLYTGEPAESSVDPAADAYLANGPQGGQMQIATGCLSARTIVHTPFGVVWCGHDDVWLFREGQLPYRIGTKIRPLIQQVIDSQANFIHAAYHNGFYKLSLPAPGQSLSFFDPPQEQWWLDLREVAPQTAAQAMWFGPQRHQFRCLDNGSEVVKTGLYNTLSDQEGNLFTYGRTVLRAGFGESAIIVVQHDLESGRDASCPTTDATFGTLAAALVLDDCEIETEIRTKEYAYGMGENTVDAGIDKTHIAVEVGLAYTEPTEIQVTTILDGGRDTDIATKAYGQTGFILGVHHLDQDVLSREFVSQLVTPDVTQRHQGKTIQYVIQDKVGYYIDENMTSFSFVVRAFGVPTNYTATLSQGFYADLVSVLDALVAAMNAAINNGFIHNQTTAIDRPPTVIIFGVQQWAPIFDPAATDSTKRVWAMLGFDTSVVPPPIDDSQIADESVPLRRSAAIDWSDIVATYNPIPRRPA